jgi:divalent metal cation (Fe/Co/Zn/Cd) transporter
MVSREAWSARDEGDPLPKPNLRAADGDHTSAGLRISLVSLIWTVFAGAAAITIGLSTDSLVLVAFGALSALDAAGSAALVVHFRHALRHEVISLRHEQVALRIITAGMAVLGVITATESVDRLVGGKAGRSSIAGVALAGASLVVLASLSTSKRRIARRIPSHALHSDGWLSAVGSMLAAATLAGTALFDAYRWWWIDAAASLVIAAAAIALSAVLARGASLGGEEQAALP